MSYEALLEEYEARRAKALAGGGEDKYAKRNAAGIVERARAHRSTARQGHVHRVGPLRLVRRLSRAGGRDADRRQDRGLRPDRRPRRRGRRQRLHRQRRIDQRDQQQESRAHEAHRDRARHAARRHRRIDRRAAARCDGLARHGPAARQRPTQFRRLRETPLAAAALGPSFGSSTWLMCLSDFAVMHKGATMAVSSPRLVSMALGEKVSAEELGGWRLHAEMTGLVDQVVDSEEEVFDALRSFLSYMPSHHNEAPPDAPVPAGSGADMDKVLRLPSREPHAGLRHEARHPRDRRQGHAVRAEAALRQERGDRARAARAAKASA